MKCNGDQEIWYSEYSNEHLTGEELIGKLHQIAYDIQFVESDTVRITIQQDEEPHDFKWSGLSDPEDWTLNDLDENWFDDEGEELEDTLGSWPEISEQQKAFEAQWRTALYGSVRTPNRDLFGDAVFNGMLKELKTSGVAVANVDLEIGDPVYSSMIEDYITDNNLWFEDEEVEEVQELNVGDVVVLRRIIKPFGLFNHFNPAIVTDKFRDPEDNALVMTVDLIYYKGMVDSDGKAVGANFSLTGYEFEETEKDLHKVELVTLPNSGRKQVSPTFADRVGFSQLCREAVNEYLLTEKLQGKLTAEVFNTKEYDGAKAMAITKKMLGG